jgi:hypothetical protein
MGYNMSEMNEINVGKSGGEFCLTTFQMTFSTADIERNIFFEQEKELISPEVSGRKIDILVVNDEMFELRDESPPCPAIGMDSQSPLFDLIGINRANNR